MSKSGRPIGSKYKVGDLTPTGNLIVDISPRPRRFNKKRQKMENDGHNFRIRCSSCQNQNNDRWTHKISEVYRCKPCYTETQRIAPNQDSTYKVLAASVKGGARKRKIEYALSLEQFKDIVQDNCFWCNQAPPLKNPKGERMPTMPAPANGIDRLDNSLGYIYTNSVSSCQMCNVAKNNHSEEKFLAWIKQVYEFKFLGIEVVA